MLQQRYAVLSFFSIVEYFVAREVVAETTMFSNSEKKVCICIVHSIKKVSFSCQLFEKAQCTDTS